MPNYNECSIYDVACRNGTCSHIRPKPTVDTLISKYAEILKTAQVGDYTYQGILAEFAKELRGLSEQSSQPKTAQPYEPIPTEFMRGPGTNTGHGHVWSRPDGQVARKCGWSNGSCKQCVRDNQDFGVAWPDRS